MMMMTHGDQQAPENGDRRKRQLRIIQELRKLGDPTSIRLADLMQEILKRDAPEWDVDDRPPPQN